MLRSQDVRLIPRYSRAINYFRESREMAANRENVPHRISTAELPAESFRKIAHPVDASCVRQVFSLGDACGLSKLGVHFCRVEPHTQSSVVHCHSHDEEWVYILEAGAAGATLLVHTGGDAEPREEKALKGDFFAFPANSGISHALRAGDQELVYLCSGTRMDMDVCMYPTSGKTLVVDRTKGGSNWFVNEAAKEPW
ncbi:Cupin-2 domain-containing protein [Phanerochaete sordida]|uniref:Cupin-2 domain-containing protein n=1 Tax=Phanerochaete sordida TaxID=48140 RepID=A0A9P3GE35_9APHY|nr:Cupin-2 domain-containing protein [Phanerochaete sordida]